MRVDHDEQGIERPVQPLPRVAGPNQGRPHCLAVGRGKVSQQGRDQGLAGRAQPPGGHPGQPGRLGDRLHGQALPAGILQDSGRGGEQPGVLHGLGRARLAAPPVRPVWLLPTHLSILAIMLLRMQHLLTVDETLVFQPLDRSRHQLVDQEVRPHCPKPGTRVRAMS